MASKLFIGNLAYSVTSDDLQQLFASHGTVESAAVINDRETGRSRGFGFVEMSTEEEAAACVKELDGYELQGRPLKVSIARPPQNRS